MWAKQNTAATLIVGPILDSTGAEYTSAVIGDLSISKNGGTLTALASAATLTHIANGQYTLVMTTGNLDTLGRLQITCNKSTYQMPSIGLNIVPAMVFDSMVLGTDVLQSDVTQFGGTAGTFAAGIPTVELDSTSVTAVQNGLATQSNVNNVGTAVVAVGTLIGTPAAASVSADVASVKSDTSSLISRLTANAATAIQNLFHMITGTGASSKYTVAALENAPSSTGGDATLAKQEEILAALEDLADTQLAAVEVDAGTISGFPETLIIGDSYSEDTGQIRINITDSVTGNPIDSLGTLDFVDADIVFTAFRPNDSARIIGTCEYVREPSSGTLTASYVLVTLLTSETAKGKAEYTYEGRLKFVWQGPSSSDETDEEQKTYKTTPFKFIANP